MPPRSVRKSARGVAKKAAGRAGKGTKKAASSSGEAPASAVQMEEECQVEQVPAVAVVEEIRDEEVVGEKPVILDLDAGASASVEAENENDMNEAFDEECPREKLALEDNEPEDETAVEYKPEDESDVDYGERDIDPGAEEVDEDEGDEDEGEDGGEGHECEEEETDLVHEIDDVGQDVEGDDNADEEHETEAEEEHQKVMEEHRKHKEFEVFVSGLNKDATEDDLRKVFTQIGEVTEVRIIINPPTKKNKGFAFLRFATVEQAKRAVSEMKNPVVCGKQCGVAPSQDSDTLFLGNICKTWTKDRLKEQLKTYGVDNMEDITFVKDTKNEGMNRGFAFLEFSSRSSAMDAYRRLRKRDVVFGVDRNAKVSLGASFNEHNEEIMAQVRTIFIDGLPSSWDEDRVNEYVKKYGVIEKIELARNMPAAKRRNFGFVTFDTHDNAVACADGINDKDLGEGGNKVKVRARLSRPHQRGRAKQGIRGNFRISRGTPRIGRTAYSRSPRRQLPIRPPKPIRSNATVGRSERSFKRPLGYRDTHPALAAVERPRRPAVAAAERPRRPAMGAMERHRRPAVAAIKRPRNLPPPERPYERRPQVPPYPKTNTRWDYGRLEELPPPRSRAPIEYGPRVPSERHTSYRDDYPSRELVYLDIPPRNIPRPTDRRAYVDDAYGRKLERSLPTYQEGHNREYDSVTGSKRPYSDLDDSQYADVSMRHSRARMDYVVSISNAQYVDSYGERLGPSHVGYDSNRLAISSHDDLYGERHGTKYGRVSGGDVGVMYSSGLNNNYMSRGSDVGGSSYSSINSSRSLNRSGYPGASWSSTYY